MNELQLQFLVYAVLALLLLKTPVVGKYVALVNTLVHEVGHAVTALLTGGRVAKIELFASSEGRAWSSHRFWFGKVLTSFAGYPVASAAAFLSVWLIARNHTEWFLIGLLAVLVSSALLWVRNVTGILWVVLTSALLGYLVYTDHNVAMTTTALALSAILVITQLTSAFDILKISVKTPLDSGDASNLMRTTLIPAPLWGIVFFAQAGIFAFFSVREVFYL